MTLIARVGSMNFFKTHYFTNMPISCSNTVFQASAGTGKTYNVIHLYTALILGESFCANGEVEICQADTENHGITPERILLMTFTENAAAELRLRAQQMLNGRLAESLAQGCPDPEHELRLRQRLRQLTSAAVCTIHSFCARILRENALAARISPRFTVLEGDERDELRNHILYEQITAGVMTIPELQELGHTIGVAQLQKLVTSFIEEMDATGRHAEDSTDTLLPSLPQPQSEEFPELYQALFANARKGRMHQLLADHNPDQVPHYPQPALEQLALNILNAQSTRSSNTHVRAIQDWAENMIAALRGGPYFAAFLSLVNSCRQAFAQAKADCGKLDFQDLIAATVSLFQRHPELAFPANDTGPATMFDVVIIDEVQDNSRLQYQLVKELWQPHLNRLVICGDNKQSIYVWRKADIRVLSDLARDMQTPDAGQPPIMVPLRTSYRSQAPLITAINELSTCIFNLTHEKVTEMDATTAAASAAETLIPLPDAGQNAPCKNVELLLPDWQAGATPEQWQESRHAPNVPVPWRTVAALEGDMDEPQPLPPFLRTLSTLNETPGQPAMPTSGEPISDEALAVARRIHLLVHGGSDWRPALAHSGRHGWTPTNGSDQPFRYRDILILLRRTKHQQVFEEALQLFAIPYTISGRGRGFFQRPEIRDLHNLMQTVVNPNDQAALLAVLRSPLIGLTDTAIAQLIISSSQAAAANRSQGALIKLILDPAFPAASQASPLQPEDRQKLTRARKLLAQGLRTAGQDTAAEMIRTLIRSAGYDAILAGSERGTASLANVKKLLDWIARHEREGLNNLSDLVRMLGKHIQDNTEEPEATIHDPSENAVQIMTVHAAKGLTRKVVFLPDLRTSFRAPDNDVFTSPNSTLDFQLKVPLPDSEPMKVATAGFQACRQAAINDSWRENQNLFYVAITRARDLVVLSGEQPSDKPGTNTWRDWVNQYLLSKMDEQTPPPPLVFRSYGQLASALPAAPACPMPPLPELRQLHDAIALGQRRRNAHKPTINLPVTSFHQVIEKLNSHGQRQTWPAPDELAEGYSGHLPEQLAPHEFSGFTHRQASNLNATAEPADQDASIVVVNINPGDEHPPDNATGRASFGTAGHAWFENLNWELPIASQIQNAGRAVALGPEQARELQNRLQLACHACPQFFQTVRNAMERFREMPFAIQFPLPELNLTINGVIDLVYQDTAGGWHLVDYKFTSLAEAELRATYALQLAVYRQALARLDIQIRSAQLFVLQTRQAMVLDIPLAALEATLTHALQTVTRAFSKA